MPALPTSLPRICVALGFPDTEQLRHVAEAEYKDGNTFLEFRLDYLGDPSRGVELVKRFRDRYSDAQILATCRHKQHEGHFKGSLERQVEILRDAGAAGAIALDLEVESAEKVKPATATLRSSAALIVSYHSFRSTPAPANILKRLERVPADAYKLVTTAHKPADTLRLTEFLKRYRGPSLISFAMSEPGLPTRILGPAFGCPFTYAAPSTDTGTAPGQIAAKTMRSLYRCDKLGKHTHVYGVIADPVGHSKSPVIHNRAFQARRMDAVYLPFLVGSPHLNEWMKLATTLPVLGFSVTIPHKQKIVRYLDVVDPVAKRIGAVNTVWRKAGKWRGMNTDVEGVLKPLSRHVRPKGSSILIAGYGGAARAAAIALADAGAQIIITGRNAARAAKLARVVKADVVSIKEAQTQEYDVLIHATPVGMSPKPNETLFPNRVPAEVVLDMVYNPHETLLLKQAREQGCTVIHGAEMLLEQAARQFEIWTGESAPRAVMHSALEQALQS
jgi:3-dehydroquinate dehydratase/shikimate dehydrogenase